MKELFNSSFELYKLKVNRYLDFPDPQKLPKLVEQIKAAAFMQEITDKEAEYLLDLLPLDINEDIDDGWHPEDVTRKTGGIKMQDIGHNPGIRKHVRDELDDFEEEEEEEESGFGNLASYSRGKRVYDELDDFDDEEEEEEESGFGSLGGYSKNKKYEYDELDDFEEYEEDEEEKESGFGSFASSRYKRDDYDELDDFEEDYEDDKPQSGFLNLL